LPWLEEFITQHDEADLLRCIEAVDRRREREEYQRRESGRFTPVGPVGLTGNSAAYAAEIVGTSQRKVKRARQVLSDPKEREAVLAGKKSIHQASRDARRKPAPKPQRDEKGKFAVQEERRQAILAKAYNKLRIWRKKLNSAMSWRRSLKSWIEKYLSRTVLTPQKPFNAFLPYTGQWYRHTIESLAPFRF
jgi:hypothetical protein